MCWIWMSRSCFSHGVRERQLKLEHSLSFCSLVMYVKVESHRQRDVQSKGSSPELFNSSLLGLKWWNKLFCSQRQRVRRTAAALACYRTSAELLKHCSFQSDTKWFCSRSLRDALNKVFAETPVFASDCVFWVCSFRCRRREIESRAS